VVNVGVIYARQLDVVSAMISRFCSVLSADFCDCSIVFISLYFVFMFIMYFTAFCNGASYNSWFY